MLYWFVVIPILAAVVSYIVPYKHAGRIIALLIHAAMTVFAFLLFTDARSGAVTENLGGFPGNMGIVLSADYLASVFVLLTAVIFLITAVYNQSEKLGPLYWLLSLIWQGLLNGIFLSRDLFNIFVLIEAATVVVSVLIMYNRDNRSMRDGMIYLMANTAAAQFYLLGVGYIYKLTGTLNMDAAADALSRLDASSALLPYALIMTSVGVKCALMPLFSWLPKAHGTPGAPSAVSAVLSGLHIKSGLYLFIRFGDLFTAIDMSDFFLVTGVITGIAGFILALSQTDIKLILAYSTISQIGMIMIGLNGGDVYSRAGGTYHIINHALFKSALFLTAGIITKAYKTREIAKIRGVMKRMPIIGAAAVMSILGITGAPLFNGSVSKYFISEGAEGFINGVIIFINLGTVIVFIKYAAMLFGEPIHAEDEIKKLPKPAKSQSAAVIILGVLCLASGIFGEQAIETAFGVDISVNAAGYLQKSAVFAASAAAGYLIYRFYVSKSAFLGRVRGFEIGFQGICVSMGLFFGVILIIAGAA